MSLSTTLEYDAAIPASANLVASTDSAPPDKTESITIILSIIGAILTLASVIVAILQYHSQTQRRMRDMERDGQTIEMNPQSSAQQAPASPP